MPLSLPPAPGTGPVAVAFSGGQDSTVLLHLLADDPAIRARGLRALHVDHGLHADSARWAETCASACAALGVDFASRRVAVRDSGHGLEAAARAARHRALLDWQLDGELIALAHHRDDQAETVLLRLLRGSGDGLSAMRSQRAFGRGWLWRPLLAVPRAELQRFAESRGLAWIEDPSNASERHDRNFLRHRVLPLLGERWPQAPVALARSAALLATQADLLAGEDARRLAMLQGLDPARLDLPGLMAQPAAWRDRLLRAWVRALQLPPLPGDATRTIDAELLAERDESRGEFRWAGAVIRRWRDGLHAGRVQAPLPPVWQAEWDGLAPLALPGGGTLALEPAGGFEGPVSVRARAGGERLVLPGRGHSSELKQVLQDLGLPPWERERLPLLFADDGELLAAGDVVVSARLSAWLQAGARRLRHTPAD
ncbi:tRNA lysidine(34) synthetase TilS [Arenimonas terrae]|uniref:tRNA(Ile)-lysidine synthase n=1 Tax=Arenimonas terrae TaxID=2546226 RepID=A0A5C4RTG0_9GAMM|nr:tRNA lysidine(34) synthetase TilS [Arenimonas terrae]TNJ34244.1 tRNA lysidine(34) synthetase TilS [Arenimonas terrae]